MWVVARDAVIEIDDFVDELNRNYHRVDGYPLKAKLKEKYGSDVTIVNPAPTARRTSASVRR